MLTARDIMTTDVVLVDETVTLTEAMARMQQHHVRALVVAPHDATDAYGILTATDIVYAVTAHQSDPDTLVVADLMTKPCVTIHPDLRIDHVARLFAHLRIHRAPVVHNRLLGIVTVGDLLRATLDQHAA